jgi:hypothetical protein
LRLLVEIRGDNGTVVRQLAGVVVSVQSNFPLKRSSKEARLKRDGLIDNVALPHVLVVLNILASTLSSEVQCTSTAHDIKDDEEEPARNAWPVIRVRKHGQPVRDRQDEGYGNRGLTELDHDLELHQAGSLLVVLDQNGGIESADVHECAFRKEKE